MGNSVEWRHYSEGLLCNKRRAGISEAAHILSLEIVFLSVSYFFHSFLPSCPRTSPYHPSHTCTRCTRYMFEKDWCSHRTTLFFFFFYFLNFILLLDFSLSFFHPFMKIFHSYWRHKKASPCLSVTDLKTDLRAARQVSQPFCRLTRPLCYQWNACKRVTHIILFMLSLFCCRCALFMHPHTLRL